MSNQPQISIFTTDVNLVVRSWDSLLAIATGLSAETACGQRLTTLVPDLQSRGLLARFDRVLASGVVEILAPAFEGYLIPCSPLEPSKHFDKMQQRVIIHPLRENDCIVGTIVTIEDVTAREGRDRELAEQLASPNEDARLRAAQSLATEYKNRKYIIQNNSYLVNALGDENWMVRRVAVDSLIQQSNAATTAQLLRSLRSEHRNPSVLNGALQVLALSDVDIIAPLIEFLNDPDTDLRIYAALALGEDRSDPRSIVALIDALEDANTNVRYHAIEALGNLRAAEAASKLLEIVKTRDFFLAFPAIDALRRIGDPTVAPHLVPLLKDELLCEPAVEALGLLGDEEVIPPLLELLNASDAPTSAIALALSALCDRYETTYREGSHIADLVRAHITPKGTQNLLKALPFANINERRALVSILGGLSGPQVEQTLARLLGAPSVRQIVMEALVRYGTRASELVVAQLNAGDLETRQAAVVVLGRIGDVRAVPALTRLLNENPQLAIASADALSLIGDAREAFEPLLELLGHPEADVRQSAIAALNSLGHPEMPSRLAGTSKAKGDWGTGIGPPKPPVRGGIAGGQSPVPSSQFPVPSPQSTIPLLRHPNPHVRESAVKIAGYFAFPECIDLLLECCYDADEAVRIASVEHLPYIEDERILPTLVSALQNETPQVRAAVARAFAQVEPEVAFPYLKIALADADSWVRYYAARSVGLQGESTSTPTEDWFGARLALTEELTRLIFLDEATHVRIAATVALGKIGGASACNLLASLAENPDAEEDLARTAIRALGAMSKRRGEDACALTEALAPLMSVLRGSNSARRIEVLRVLGQLGLSEAVDAIQWVAAGDADPNVVQAAIDALGQMRNRAAIAALIELSADRERMPACVAALSHPDTIGGIFGKEAIPYGIVETLRATSLPLHEWIGEGLTHPHPGVRSAVVDALSRLKHPRASEILIAALEDGEASVRLRAIRALGYLGNRSAEPKLAAIARTDPDPTVRRAAHKAMQSSRD